MLIGEVIERVQSLYSKGVKSDDSRLSSRHIYNKLLSLRSKYIAQQAKKKQKINQWNYQTLSCVELIKVSLYDCPCVLPIECSILRTKYKLPKPLINLNSHLLQSVTSLDGRIIFSEIDWIELKYKYSNKYTAHKPDFFIKNEYLYIVGLTQKIRHIKTISITGLFEDFIEVFNYPSYCSNECQECNPCTSVYDIEFVMDVEYLDSLVNEASQELIVFYNQNREDLTNDSEDNITEESK